MNAPAAAFSPDRPAGPFSISSTRGATAKEERDCNHGGYEQGYGAGLTETGDLTETRYWESRQKIMVGEFQHRVKNILANLVAVVKLMQRQAISRDEFVQALEGRLYSLARTQELLVAGPGDAAEFHELVRLELLSSEPLKVSIPTSMDRRLLSPHMQPKCSEW
jgi:two-component sensor histidine kinase